MENFHLLELIEIDRQLIPIHAAVAVVDDAAVQQNQLALSQRRSGLAAGDGELARAESRDIEAGRTL